MDVNKQRFNKRVNALEKKTSPRHRVERRVTKDGLIVEVVKRRRPKLLPIRSILLAAMIFVLCKGFLLAQLGSPEYQSRIEDLQAGDSLQITAAFLLDVDPATQLVANFLNKYLRAL